MTTTFDPAIFAALASNPAAQAQYLASINGAAQPAAQPSPGPQGQPATPTAPAARGTLSQGFDQGAASGSYGTSIKFPTVGSAFTGTVARDMLDTDVTQVTDFTTKQPKFLKSGDPQWQYKISLNCAPSADYPEGKATLWTTKYRLHSAVVRAMITAGYQNGEGLREGDQVTVIRAADVATQGQPGHDYTVTIGRSGNVSAAPAAAAPSVNSAPVTTPPVTPVQTSAATAPAQTTPAPAQTSNGTQLTAEQAALVAQYTGAGV